MANVLGDDKKDQILALGRLGWPLRRIERATGVRRETASAYLKAAGIAIRTPRQRQPPPSRPVRCRPTRPYCQRVWSTPTPSPPPLCQDE
jgi:transposase